MRISVSLVATVEMKWNKIKIVFIWGKFRTTQFSLSLYLTIGPCWVGLGSGSSSEYPSKCKQILFITPVTAKLCKVCKTLNLSWDWVSA